MFCNRPSGTKIWRSGNNFESFEEIEGKLGFICRTIHAQRVINRHAADINPSGISDQPSGCNFTHHDKYTSTRANIQITFCYGHYCYGQFGRKLYILYKEAFDFESSYDSCIFDLAKKFLKNKYFKPRFF